MTQIVVTLEEKPNFNIPKLPLCNFPMYHPVSLKPRENSQQITFPRKQSKQRKSVCLNNNEEPFNFSKKKKKKKKRKKKERKRKKESIAATNRFSVARCILQFPRVARFIVSPGRRHREDEEKLEVVSYSPLSRNENVVVPPS